MSEPRDLEVELWKVYDRMPSVADGVERVDRELKVLDLVLKTRSAGEKADPRNADPKETSDSSLAKARQRANGVTK